jgi:hypothetical protein
MKKKLLLPIPLLLLAGVLLSCSWLKDNISTSNSGAKLFPITVPKEKGSNSSIYGFINAKGEVIIKPQYSSAGDFSEGLAGVCGDSSTKSKCGFIDETGKAVVELQFDSVGIFSQGLASVSVGGRCGYSGDFVARPQFSGAKFFSDGLGAVQDGRVWGFVDKQGKTVINPRFDDVALFSDGLAPARDESGKWGYIDKKGIFTIRPQFDLAYSFSEGLAAVRNNKSKWGFIDTSGRFVIEAQFDEVRAIGYKEANIGEISLSYGFSEGLAAINVSGSRDSEKTGYIDKTGKFVINPQFCFGDNFKGGVARVCGLAYIDRTGKEIWSEKLGQKNK